LGQSTTVQPVNESISWAWPIKISGIEIIELLDFIIGNYNLFRI